MNPKGLGSPYAAQAQQVYDTAMALSHDERDRLQTTYKQRWSLDGHRAACLAFEAARLHGRGSESDHEAMCRHSGGASDAHIAVLTHDRLTSGDYRLLMAAWVECGHADPHGVVTR